jgi:uncharacterized protein YjbJ (UPF0337 family)
MPDCGDTRNRHGIKEHRRQSPQDAAAGWFHGYQSRPCRDPVIVIEEDIVMDKDRIAGAAKQIKGSIKQAVGKAVGDAKLESDGKADKVAGKVQNAIGGLKDALRE